MMDPAGSGQAIINIAVAEIDLLPRGKGRRHKITARTFLSDKHQQRIFFFASNHRRIDRRCSVEFEDALSEDATTVSIRLYCAFKIISKNWFDPRDLAYK